jgi:hypothetical protein
MAKQRHLKFFFVPPETPLAAQQSYGHVPHFSTCPVCMVTGLLKVRRKSWALVRRGYYIWYGGA